MANQLQEIIQTQGSLAVLKIYGLDQILSDQDDLSLWACVVAQHWLPPWHPELEPGAMRFGVCREVLPGETNLPISRSGMHLLETWCFQPCAPDQLRVIPCELEEGVALRPIRSGRNIADHKPGFPMVLDYLDISRPSYGQEMALVHKGISMRPKAGSGETRWWKRQDNCLWEETDEVFSRWIA